MLERSEPMLQMCSLMLKTARFPHKQQLTASPSARGSATERLHSAAEASPRCARVVEATGHSTSAAVKKDFEGRVSQCAAVLKGVVF